MTVYDVALSEALELRLRTFAQATGRDEGEIIETAIREFLDRRLGVTSYGVHAVDASGEVALPFVLRRDAKLAPGQYFKILVRNGTIELHPVSAKNRAAAEKLKIVGTNASWVVPAAVDFYRDVLAGRWSAAVPLVSDWLSSWETCAAELDELGASSYRACPPTEPFTAQSWMLDAEAAIFTGERRILENAVDTYSRVIGGQWGRMGEPFGRFADSAPNLVRVKYQNDKGYPEHPSASIGIASSPLRAKVAYDVWKALGGGVVGRGFIGTGAKIFKWEDEQWTEITAI